MYDECTIGPKDFIMEDGKLYYEWKGHGLTLELPEKCSATFNLKTVSSNKFKLPKEIKQLISPVYWIESEGDLGGPVGLVLQHYVTGALHDLRNGLRFAECRVENGKSSRSFKFRDDGVFTENSHGKLEIEHFSAWRITIGMLNTALGLSTRFIASLYYQQVSPSTYLINFVVVPWQEAYERV